MKVKVKDSDKFEKNLKIEIGDSKTLGEIIPQIILLLEEYTLSENESSYQFYIKNHRAPLDLKSDLQTLLSKELLYQNLMVKKRSKPSNKFLRTLGRTSSQKVPPKDNITNGEQPLYIPHVDPLVVKRLIQWLVRENGKKIFV